MVPYNNAARRARLAAGPWSARSQYAGTAGRPCRSCNQGCLMLMKVLMKVLMSGGSRVRHERQAFDPKSALPPIQINSLARESMRFL